MRVSLLKGLAVGLASVSLVLPPPVVAAWSHATPIPSSTRGEKPVTAVMDIALRDQGVLTGQVTTEDGKPLAGVPVALEVGGGVVANTTTDPHGAFSLASLRGGVYQVTIPGACQTCRLWAPWTAPPAASPVLRLVIRPQLARGQSPSRSRGFLVQPLIVGGLVATAVAVPLAVHSHNSHTNLVTE